MAEIKAICPVCNTENFWPECGNCHSEDLKGHWNSSEVGLSAVECKKCGEYSYPPIECFKCGKNINSKLWKDPGPCFIATAVMQDYNHPIVYDLRLFRDNWLTKRKWGQLFINWYYKNGEYAAKYISKSNLLKKLSYYFIVKPLYNLVKTLRLHK